MQKEDYYIFYDKVIAKYIEEIQSEDETYGCISINKNAKHYIYMYYEQKRTEIRNEYMMSSNNPLDRHKIASAFMYAILKSKIIKVNKLISSIPEKLLMSNQYLAVYVGLNIVELYKRDDKNFMFNKDYSLIFPKTYKDNTTSTNKIIPFVSDLCKSLYYIKNINTYDIFAYSITFFFLERYTDTCLEHDKQLNEVKQQH